MITTCVGLAGIAVLLLYDLVTLRQWRGRGVLALLGYGLHGGAILAATLARERCTLPVGSAGLGWLLFLPGFSWLIYSLFLFAPIANTYVVRDGPVLITSGPYACCRHPGLIGHALTIGGLVLISRSTMLARGGLIWIGANLVYVLWQDQWLFPRLFPDYNDYKMTTPMLIPSRSSIRYLLNTWRLQ